MRSRALVIGAGVAAVATVAILLWPRSTADNGSEDEAIEAGRAVPADGTRTGTKPTADDQASDEDQGGEDETPLTGRVRDHRGQVPTHPRPRLPGDRPKRLIQAPIIRGLRQALRPEIKRCSDQYGKDLTAGAVIQGSLRVTVQGGVLSVVEAKVSHRGMPESSGLIECARKAFAAAKVEAEGHDDVESHTIRLPFPVPVK
jgi:hypothetical protein